MQASVDPIHQAVVMTDFSKDTKDRPQGNKMTVNYREFYRVISNQFKVNK